MSGALPFSVIIPVFNKWELTEACLRSLREHTRSPFEVLVADNASSDATATELEALGRGLFGERFRRLRFEENRNFGPACNAAAAEAKAPLLFFLNNDTLLTPGWDAPLLRAMADEPELGGLGPLLLYEDGTVQHLGVTFTAFGVAHLYRGFPASHPVVKKRRRLQAVTAAALLMPRALFLEHQGFHEGYRNGFEDVDLCLRIRAAGKGFACIPESRVYHLESQTPGRKRDEEYNSALAAERCMGLARIDVHLFGLADGFVPFVNDLLGLGLCLSGEDEAALLREADGRDAAFWLGLSRAHPLWTAGRERVAEELEKRGRYRDALELRADIAAILGSERSCRQMLRCAVRGKDGISRAHAEKKLRWIMELGQNRAAASGLVDKLVRKAGQFDDDLLARMYRDKFDQLFGGG